MDFRFYETNGAEPRLPGPHFMENSTTFLMLPWSKAVTQLAAPRHSWDFSPGRAHRPQIHSEATSSEHKYQYTFLVIYYILFRNCLEMNKARLKYLKKMDHPPQMIQKVKEDTWKYQSLKGGNTFFLNQWHIHKPLSPESPCPKTSERSQPPLAPHQALPKLRCSRRHILSEVGSRLP